MWQIGKFRTKEDRADAELRQLLGSDMSDVESLQGTLPWRRQKRDSSRSIFGQANGNLTDDGDDEILESLVKTATKGPSRTAPRERKRTRHADRKSCKFIFFSRIVLFHFYVYTHIFIKSKMNQEVHWKFGFMLLCKQLHVYIF